MLGVLERLRIYIIFYMSHHLHWLLCRIGTWGMENLHHPPWYPLQGLWRRFSNWKSWLQRGCGHNSKTSNKANNDVCYLFTSWQAQSQDLPKLLEVYLQFLISKRSGQMCDINHTWAQTADLWKQTHMKYTNERTAMCDWTTSECYSRPVTNRPVWVSSSPPGPSSWTQTPLQGSGPAALLEL